MKRKIISVLFVLVLVAVFTLMPAMPAMAGDPTAAVTTPGAGITNLTGAPIGSGTEAGSHSIVVTDATASTLTGLDAEHDTNFDTICNNIAGTEVLTVTIAGETITTGALDGATAGVTPLITVRDDIQDKINTATIDPDVDVTVTVVGETPAKRFCVTVNLAGVSNSITTPFTGDGADATRLHVALPVAGTDAKAVDTFTPRPGSNGLWVVANSGSTKTITHTTAPGTASTLAGLEALVEVADAFIAGITLDAPGGLTAGGPAVVTVTEGTAGYLTVTGDTSMTAGTTNELTVKAYDDADNQACLYTGDKNLIFSGPLPAPDTTPPTVEAVAIGQVTVVNFGSGVSPVNAATLIAYRAETTTVHVSDAVIDSTGYGLGLTVNPDVLASFTIGGTPASILAGTAFPSPITVTAYDACLNVKTDYVGTVIWSSSASASLPVNYTFDGGDAGVHIFPGSEFTLFSTGTHTITVTDAAVFKTSSGIAVTAVIGGGWVPPAPTPTIEANLFGDVFRFRTTTTGEIRETIQATSEDGNLTLTIPAGTIALDEDGNPLSTLTSGVDVSPPPPPSHIIGLAYNFGPDGATFDPAITLTWNYDPDALPEGVAEEDLVIECYVEEAGEWEECPSTVDPETNCVTASTSHFTTFAIIAHAVPAAFSASNLSIQPSEVQPKEAVTITLSVANTGGMEGSYAVVLKINGVKEAEKDVTVAAGNSQSVSFSVTREKAGSYSVAVNGLSGSFTVKEPVPTPAPPPAPPPPAPEAINWWLIGGIIAAVVVVGLLIFFLVVRRRA